MAALGQNLLKDLPRVDVLANNAGGMFARGARTEDGFETTFQVNHLAHFLLTRLLLDRLLRNKGRVINTSSIAHKALVLRYNPRRPDRPFLGSAHLAYGNAKLANILFTRELHRRYHQSGLSAAAFHPGIVLTDFSKNTRSPMRIAYTRGNSRFMRMKSPGKGRTPWSSWRRDSPDAIGSPAATMPTKSCHAPAAGRKATASPCPCGR